MKNFNFPLQDSIEAKKIVDKTMSAGNQTRCMSSNPNYKHKLLKVDKGIHAYRHASVGNEKGLVSKSSYVNIKSVQQKRGRSSHHSRHHSKKFKIDIQRKQGMLS